MLPIAHARQVHEPDAIRKAARPAPRRFDGETTLAAAASSGQGDQSVPGECRADLPQLLLASDEAGERAGKSPCHDSTLSGRSRVADAWAAEESSLFVLGREDFLDTVWEHRKLASGLLTRVAERLRRDMRVIHRLAFLKVPGRLAEVLLDLARDGEAAGDAEITIEAQVSHADIAAMVGATRPSVTKWMGVLEQQGMLRYAGRRIVLTRPADLRRSVA